MEITKETLERMRRIMDTEEEQTVAKLNSIMGAKDTINQLIAMVSLSDE